MKTYRYGYLFIILGLVVIVGVLASMIFSIPENDRDKGDSGDVITVVPAPTGPSHLQKGQSAVRRSDATAPAEEKPDLSIMGSDATRTPPDRAVETALERDAQQDVVEAQKRALERQRSSGANDNDR